MNDIVVYIAGKMTGDPNYSAKFDKAEKALIAEGYEVINPACLPADLEYGRYWPIKGMLEASDAIYMLLDWQNSAGANKALLYALTNKKIIMFETKD